MCIHIINWTFSWQKSRIQSTCTICTRDNSCLKMEKFKKNHFLFSFLFNGLDCDVCDGKCMHSIHFVLCIKQNILHLFIWYCCCWNFEYVPTDNVVQQWQQQSNPIQLKKTKKQSDKFLLTKHHNKICIKRTNTRSCNIRNNYTTDLFSKRPSRWTAERISARSATIAAEETSKITK